MPSTTVKRKPLPAKPGARAVKRAALGPAVQAVDLPLKKTEFPAYRIALVEELLAYRNNPRTHTPAQVDLLAKMITEYGWTNPVLLDGALGILAGHGRVLAAQKLGMLHVPVIELSHLSEAQRRAYVIADNASALKAGWDDDLLRLELGALLDQGFDLNLTGFDPGELLGLFAAGKGLTDPDDAPPVQERAISVLGDVWLLGNHRLVCGDSTSADVTGAALNGHKPHLMVTDPPYGVSYDADWRNQTMRSTGEPFGARAIGKVENDTRVDWSEAWSLFPGTVAYVWHAAVHGSLVAESLASCKFAIRAAIVWVKAQPVIGRGDYNWQHEPLFYAVTENADDQWRFVPEHEIASYAVRAGSVGQWSGGRKQSTVWNIEHVKSETGHSTQKPIECMRRPIENNSKPGDRVYEPFSGSGTTILAAEMTGRICHAIELSPHYVDVAVRRWQAYTGEQATHAVTGLTFAEVEAAS